MRSAPLRIYVPACAYCCRTLDLLNPSLISEKIEQRSDAGGNRSALSDVDGMKSFTVAWIEVFEHRHKPANRDVVPHGKSRKSGQPVSTERKLAQGLAIARLHAADCRNDDRLAIILQRPSINCTDIAEPKPIMAFEVSDCLGLAEPAQVGGRTGDHHRCFSEVPGDKA